MAIDYASIGKRIQNKRKSLHKTQESLAEAIFVTVGYISQIERGITKVNLETLSKIAEILECDIIDFLDGSAENSSRYLSDDLQTIFNQLNTTNKKNILGICEVLLKSQSETIGRFA